MFGRWGEENFPCLKLWSFTSQTFGLRGISARSSYFIQVYFLSVLLFFLYFFLFTLTFLLLLLLLLLLFHFLFLPFCCQFQRIFANFSPGAEGGIFLGWGAREGGGGEIRLITSHTERTKFFIARKKAASFRDTLVLQKTLGSWDLSFQNFFTKGRFQVIPQ